MAQEIDVVHAALRADLALFIQRVFAELAPSETFQPNWHIEAMAYHLSQAWKGEIRRLLMNLPPRHMKSIAASVAFVAWLLGHDPSLKIICGSYGADLAVKLSNDTRRVMQSPWYRRCFPRTVISAEKNTESFFMTEQQGYRVATSVGGPLRGLGADYLIIDDPDKAGDANAIAALQHTREWFQGTALTRLNSPKEGRIIVAQQRVHEADLSGHVLESGGWTHLNLPAIAERSEEILVGPGKTHVRRAGDVLHPERMPQSVLDQIRSDIGSLAFATQYQQRPGPPGGEIVNLDWFERYHKLPALGVDCMIVQSWDTAHTMKPHSSYSVCTTWLYYNYCLYLIHVLREKTEFVRLQYLIPEHADRFGANMVVIEGTGPALGLVKTLYTRYPFKYCWTTPQLDKASRLQAVSQHIEAGRVYLPEEAPWLPDFLQELRNFPNGRYSDQVDTLSQVLEWMLKTRAGAPPGMFPRYEQRRARRQPPA